MQETCFKRLSAKNVWLSSVEGSQWEGRASFRVAATRTPTCQSATKPGPRSAHCRNAFEYLNLCGGPDLGYDKKIILQINEKNAG